MRWQEQAACHGKTPRFFLEAFRPLAKATCDLCPVRVECQRAGMGEDFGVWGGLAVAERKRVVEKRKRAS